MSFVLRVVFSWVLALAIPVQGFAASTMLACAGGHQHPPAAATAVHEHAHELAGDHEHPHQDQHDHGAVTASSSDEPGSQPGPSSCSACAACCSLLALPSAAPIVAEPERLAGHEAPPAFTAPAFVTDGPERPPRASHA